MILCCLNVRRHLKWASAEYENAQHHDAACDWNSALVSEALPHALYHTAMYAIQHGYSARDVMMLFPDPSLALPHWEALVNPFYQRIKTEAIFYTEEDGGRWVRASEACMIAGSGAQADVISKILLKTKQRSNLVKPPQHMLTALSTTQLIQVQEQTIVPIRSIVCVYCPYPDQLEL